MTDQVSRAVTLRSHSRPLIANPTWRSDGVTMADLTLYHAAPSRSSVTLWMLEELGVPYDIKLLKLSEGDQLKPDYLAINPMGKVPAIKHKDVVITESAAICTYLADAFPEKKLNVPLGDPRRAGFVGVGQHGQEFFAPEAGHEAPPRDRLFETRGEFDQHRVPRGVAVAVVHLLEAVDVDAQNRHRFAACRLPVARGVIGLFQRGAGVLQPAGAAVARVHGSTMNCSCAPSHTGQRQCAGSAANGVPGGNCQTLSPCAGSYTHQQILHSSRASSASSPGLPR